MSMNVFIRVKSYLRYVLSDSLGVITNSNTNIQIKPSNDNLVFSCAIESIKIWNVRSGVLVHQLSIFPNSLQSHANSLPTVTYLSHHPVDSNVLAAGYSDGTIRLWNISQESCDVVFNGHTSTITCLIWSIDYSLLFSSSNDTTIIVWDVLSEHGLYRLKGHRAPITCLNIFSSINKSNQYLISSSKDKTIKVWDLLTQHCIQTLTTSNEEIWSMLINKQQNILITGGSEKECRVFRIKPFLTTKQRQIYQPTENLSKRSKVYNNGDNIAATALGVAADFVNDDESNLIVYWGIIPRLSSRRVVNLFFSSDDRLLAIQCQDKLIEMFLVKDEKKIIHKKKKNIKKRKKEEEKESLTDNIISDPTENDFNNSTINSNHSDDIDDNNNSNSNNNNNDYNSNEDISDDTNEFISPKDIFYPLPPLRLEQKVAYASFAKSQSTNRHYNNNDIRVIASLTDNSLVSHQVNIKTTSDFSSSYSSAKLLDSSISLSNSYFVDLPGHRQPIRTVSLSFDNQSLLSGSADSLKLWNISSGTVIKTISLSSPALCSLFLPGSRYAVIGCKGGEIEWFDLLNGDSLGRIQGHEGAIYCLGLRSDGKGFASGGEDKKVKCWEFELIQTNKIENKLSNDSSTPNTRVLSIYLHSSLTLTDDILCLRYSPNGKYLGVGLLDSTVKLFHSDSLAFFLSLYGHKLPVLSIDFSSDSSLLVSASADKNVKVWGVSFGDCHCSLFAHGDSVTGVRFLPSSHYFVSIGKDGIVKLWDADKKLQIQTLRAHSSEIWAVEVSGSYANIERSNAATKEKLRDDNDLLVHGELIVTAGNDRSIRLWRQSEEQLFIEEEKELELESRSMEEAKKSESSGQLGERDGVVLGMDQSSSGNSSLVASNRTAQRLESLRSSERLIEAIDMGEVERSRRLTFEKEKKSHSNEEANPQSLDEQKNTNSIAAIVSQLQSKVPSPASSSSSVIYPLNPFLYGGSSTSHLLHVLQSIRSSELEDALLLLPADYAYKLIFCCNSIIEEVGIST